MGEVVEHLIECGHEKDRIFHDYTIDQLWLFYNKSVILRRKRQHEDAILFANCIILGNPYAGKDAGKNFQKFLDSLLPDSFKKGLRSRKAQVKAPADIHRTFQQLGQDFGVPMQQKQKQKKNS